MDATPKVGVRMLDEQGKVLATYAFDQISIDPLNWNYRQISLGFATDPVIPTQVLPPGTTFLEPFVQSPTRFDIANLSLTALRP